MANNFGVFWVRDVLELLEEKFSDSKGKPNVTLPVENKEDIDLVFSFEYNDDWYGFGISEKDFDLTPEDLVNEVMKDLSISV